jgi:hypothetical protein
MMSESEANRARFSAAASDRGPTVLPPAERPSGRWNRGAWYFRDDILKRFEVVLDEAFRVPFTKVRFGIDGIVGLVPGLGDALTGLVSLVIPFAAWARGVPYVTLVRMAANLAIGVLVGSVPVLGDIFDIGWKSNRRNYILMQRHLVEPRRHTWRDWTFLLMILAGLIAIIAIPLAVGLWCIAWLLRQ